jgi:hypothetical protein
MQNVVDICFKIFYNKQKEDKMKLNYLLPEKEANELCDGSRTKLRKHSWMPGGQFVSLLMVQLELNFFAKGAKEDIGIFLLSKSTRLIKIF